MAIMLSVGVRQNLQAMQSTARMMTESQHHLATGKKVNSALDNPTNFFTASALDARAGDLNNLMDFVGNAIQTIEAADNGISAIQKLVESAQGTARQALQAAKGETTTEGVVGTLTASVAGTNTITADETVAFSVNGTSTSVTFAAGDMDTLQHVADKITADVADLTATIDGDGKLVLTADNTGEDIIVTDGTGTAADFGFTSAASSTDDVVEVVADSTTRLNLENEYNDLLLQIDQLATDASFNGNNFLDGDNLKVIFNETGTSALNIKGIDASSSGLSLSANIAGDFQDDDKIEATLKTLDTAMGTLRSVASTYGSNLSVVQTRQDFTEAMVNTLNAGASNLTMADLNAEGANLLALQTRQQLATTALSMASQADQSVLSFLR